MMFSFNTFISNLTEKAAFIEELSNQQVAAIHEDPEAFEVYSEFEVASVLNKNHFPVSKQCRHVSTKKQSNHQK